MRTLGTHKDLSVSPPSVSITILGDLEEKWVSFAIMLHTYLAKKKKMRRTSNGKWRSYESTVR